MRLGIALALAAVVVATAAAGPARAEQLSGEHAPNLMNVFFESCVKHLQDNYEKIGETMSSQGFTVEERDEVHKAVLGDTNGRVWSGQSQAGIVIVSVSEQNVCAMDIIDSNTAPAALRTEFARMSEELLRALKGPDGSEVKRETDEGRVDLGGQVGEMDYVSHVFTSPNSDVAIYMEMSSTDRPDVRRRARLSISYVKKQS